MRSFTALAIPPAGVKALEFKADDLLGRGFLSTLGDTKTLLVPPTDFETAPGSEVAFGLELADSRSSFSKQLSFSANAKFGFSSGSASARLSWSSSYRKSHRALSVVMTKTVKTDTQFLRDPMWRNEALMAAKDHGEKKFLLRYGDQFVRKVRTGGLMTLVYTLQFSDMESRSQFDGDFEASYGAAKGGAEFHQKVLEKATAQSISIRGIVSGVLRAPNIFVEQQGVDQVTGETDARSRQVDVLLNYFTDFEAHVQEDGVAGPFDFETQSVTVCANAPFDAEYNLNDETRALDDAARLDDEIDDRLATVDYVEGPARGWNTGIKQADIDALRSSLLTSGVDLIRCASQVATLDANALNFSDEDVPAIPPSWHARRLVQVTGFPKSEKVIDNPGLGTFRKEYQLPRLETGAPFQLHIKIHWEAASHPEAFSLPGGVMHVAIGRSNGQRIELFGGELKFPDAHPRDPEDTWVFTYDPMMTVLVLDAKVGNGKIAYTIDLLA